MARNTLVTYAEGKKGPLCKCMITNYKAAANFHSSSYQINLCDRGDGHTMSTHGDELKLRFPTSEYWKSRFSSLKMMTENYSSEH